MSHPFSAFPDPVDLVPAMVQPVVWAVVHGAPYAGAVITGGDMWPQADLGALDELARQWQSVAEQLNEAQLDLVGLAAEVSAWYQGDTGQEFMFASFDLLGVGGEVGLGTLAQAASDRYMVVFQGAMDIHMTMMSIAIEALVTALSAMWAMISMIWTAGTSGASIPALVTAGRQGVVRFAGEAIRWLAEMGAGQAFRRLSLAGLERAAIEAGQELLEEAVLIAGGTQLAQMATGRRDWGDFDVSRLAEAGIAGAVGGAAGVFIFGNNFLGLGNLKLVQRLTGTRLGGRLWLYGQAGFQNSIVSFLGSEALRGREALFFGDGGLGGMFSRWAAQAPGAALAGSARVWARGRGIQLGQRLSPVTVNLQTGEVSRRGWENTTDPGRLLDLTRAQREVAADLVQSGRVIAHPGVPSTSIAGSVTAPGGPTAAPSDPAIPAGSRIAATASPAPDGNGARPAPVPPQETARPGAGSIVESRPWAPIESAPVPPPVVDPAHPSVVPPVVDPVDPSAAPPADPADPAVVRPGVAPAGPSAMPPAAASAVPPAVPGAGSEQAVPGGSTQVERTDWAPIEPPAAPVPPAAGPAPAPEGAPAVPSAEPSPATGPVHTPDLSLQVVSEATDSGGRVHQTLRLVDSDGEAVGSMTRVFGPPSQGAPQYVEHTATLLSVDRMTTDERPAWWRFTQRRPNLLMYQQVDATMAALESAYRDGGVAEIRTTSDLVDPATLHENGFALTRRTPPRWAAHQIREALTDSIGELRENPRYANDDVLHSRGGEQKATTVDTALSEILRNQEISDAEAMLRRMEANPGWVPEASDLYQVGKLGRTAMHSVEWSGTRQLADPAADSGMAAPTPDRAAPRSGPDLSDWLRRPEVDSGAVAGNPPRLTQAQGMLWVEGLEVPRTDRDVVPPLLEALEVERVFAGNPQIEYVVRSDGLIVSRETSHELLHAGATETTQQAAGVDQVTAALRGWAAYQPEPVREAVSAALKAIEEQDRRGLVEARAQLAPRAEQSRPRWEHVSAGLELVEAVRAADRLDQQTALEVQQLLGLPAGLAEALVGQIRSPAQPGDAVPPAEDDWELVHAFGGPPEVPERHRRLAAGSVLAGDTATTLAAIPARLRQSGVDEQVVEALRRALLVHARESGSARPQASAAEIVQTLERLLPAGRDGLTVARERAARAEHQYLAASHRLVSEALGLLQPSVSAGSGELGPPAVSPAESGRWG